MLEKDDTKNYERSPPIGCIQLSIALYISAMLKQETWSPIITNIYPVWKVITGSENTEKTHGKVSLNQKCSASAGLALLTLKNFLFKSFWQKAWL